MTIDAYVEAMKERFVTDLLVTQFHVIRERSTLMDGYLRARLTLANGKQPSVWTIAAIARVLGVSMDDLAGLPEAAQAAPSTTRPGEDAHAEKPTAKRPRTRKAATVV
jgi:hypothetical protein